MCVLISVLNITFTCCVVSAVVSDLRTQKVYRFIWWIAKGCALVSLLLCNVSIEKLFECIMFILIQEILFRKLYGASDVQAFEAFSMLLCSKGYGIRYDLYHMYLSFLLLTLVQLFRRNINSKGNLHNQVAFIPYISMGYYILIFLLESDIV